MMNSGALTVICVLISCYHIDNTLAQSQGQSCKVARSGAPGTCRLISNCPAVIEEIATLGRYPTPCTGHVGSLAVICCPNPPVVTTRAPYIQSDRISAQKCTEYSEAVYENITIFDGPYRPPIVRRESKCAITTVPFIVGGVAAAPKEFPHMALLGYQADARVPITYECGGTLISENFVLTAAHCVSPNRIIGDVQFVLLGEYVVDSTEDDARPMLFSVIERITHEGFKYSSKYDDIALLRLDRNVPFSQYIRPACLAETYSDSPDGKAIASGWGRTENRGKASTLLMKVTLELFTKDECANTYRNEARSKALSKGIIDEQQFCAGSHKEVKDTCQGDSGGPIQVNHRYRHCMYTILGVTSFGKRCGEIGTPGVYTRTYGYLDWIESRVWPSRN